MRNRLNSMQSARLMNMLEAHFDRANCRYEAGWSDERIAVEAEVTPVNVTNRRAAYFGKLRKYQGSARFVPLIKAHFDAAHTRYHDGWSDERIAQETGGSATYVAKKRRELGFTMPRFQFQSVMLAPAPAELPATREALDEMSGLQTMLADELDRLKRDFVDLVHIVKNIAPGQMTAAMASAIAARYPQERKTA